MPKFEVTYRQAEIYVVTVEADSKNDAQDIVSQMIEDGTIEQHHHDSDGEFIIYEV